MGVCECMYGFGVHCKSQIFLSVLTMCTDLLHSVILFCMMESALREAKGVKSDKWG